MYAVGPALIPSVFNQFIIKTCLTTRDPMPTRRTWGTVMDQMKTHVRESTQIRCARAMNYPAFRSIRNIKLVETRSEDFLGILNGQRSNGKLLEQSEAGVGALHISGPES